MLTGNGNSGKLYSISRSEKTGWTVVDCVSVKELLKKSNQAQSIYALTSVALVIVALFFSRLYLRKHYAAYPAPAGFHGPGAGGGF